MSKLSLTLLVALSFVALFGWSGTRAQASTRYEYVRAVAYASRQQEADVRAGVMIIERAAYRACRAAEADWNCRDFAPANGPDSPLRSMLSTLGSEGWELVSAVAEENNRFGLTYLFKRPVR
jgi:hypothetical protein